MKTLDLYLASSQGPVQVRIPNKGQSGDWSADLAQMYSDLEKLALYSQPEFYSIILPAGGLTLASGQEAYWDLLSDIQASNPLAEDFKVFLPVLSEAQGTPNWLKQYNEAEVEISVTEMPLRLYITNTGPTAKTLYGLIYFPTHRNYESGLGST